MTHPQWPSHPAADRFPLLAGDDLAELAEDIRANGLLEPIWLWNEVDVCLWLLDGRNRVAACKIAGVGHARKPSHGHNLGSGASPAADLARAVRFRCDVAGAVGRLYR
jgi:hypothetical protein